MNPFFMETLDETGDRYVEEIQRDPRNAEPLPEGVMAKTFAADTGDFFEGIPMSVGPSGPPQVGPVVDDTPLSASEIDRQIAELEALTKGDEETVYNDPVFLEALKGAENSVKEGFEDGVWKPHESLEGGTKTLGYGHKLTAKEAKDNAIMIGGEKVSLDVGLSEEQVEALMEQDIIKVNKRLSDIRGYKKFPQKYKDVLTNISFNVGRVSEKGWPNLFKAIRAGDDAGVRREMVTSYKDEDGNRQQLQARATQIADAVGLTS